MTVLVDSTVISNFAAIRRLDLLEFQWPTLYLAQAVYDELLNGVDDGYVFLSDIENHVFSFHSEGFLSVIGLEGEEELTSFDSAPGKLHSGEAMSIAIAAHRGWLFLTDDRAARAYATRLGVAVSGTLGILVELIARGHLALDEANSLLQQMVEKARYQSPVEDLSILLPGQ